MKSENGKYHNKEGTPQKTFGYWVWTIGFEQ
jgi:hypothetical protein